LDVARRHLSSRPEQPFTGREPIFWSPAPLRGRIAFVYPGSGNDFHGMGRDLALRWPGVLRRQDAENERLRSQFLPDLFWRSDATPATVRQRIMAQVSLGSLTSDILLSCGVRPDAAIGYSLGESAALFALRAWPGRDEMLHRLEGSTLFTEDLTGAC